MTAETEQEEQQQPVMEVEGDDEEGSYGPIPIAQLEVSLMVANISLIRD